MQEIFFLGRFGLGSFANAITKHTICFYGGQLIAEIVTEEVNECRRVSWTNNSVWVEAKQHTEREKNEEERYEHE